MVMMALGLVGLVLAGGASAFAPVPAARLRPALRAAGLAAAAPPVEAFEAFEAAAIVRGAAKIVTRLATGGSGRAETMEALTELVEPLDVLAIAAL